MANEIIMLSNVRLSFPKLIEAAANKDFPNADPSFGADFLLAQSHPGYADFMGCVARLASEKWKENAQSVLTVIQNDRRLRCYGMGSERLDKKTFKPYNGYEGNAYLSANAKQDKPPQMIKPDGSVADAGNTMMYRDLARKLYGGCYTNVALKPWTQDNQFGRAIRCELIAIQFAADGEAFGEAAPDLTGKFGAVAVPVTPASAPFVPPWQSPPPWQS
jgi:hypothetical protein